MYWWWLEMVEIFVNYRKCMDCSVTYNNRSGRLRSVVSGMECSSAWLDCRASCYSFLCFNHSHLRNSSMQLLQNSWSWTWSRPESLLSWSCWHESRYVTILGEYKQFLTGIHTDTFIYFLSLNKFGFILWAPSTCLLSYLLASMLLCLVVFKLIIGYSYR